MQQIKMKSDFENDLKAISISVRSAAECIKPYYPNEYAKLVKSVNRVDDGLATMKETTCRKFIEETYNDWILRDEKLLTCKLLDGCFRLSGKECYPDDDKIEDIYAKIPEDVKKTIVENLNSLVVSGVDYIMAGRKPVRRGDKLVSTVHYMPDIKLRVIKEARDDLFEL